MKIEYRVRAVSRYVVTKHRIRDDGSTETSDCAEVSTIKGATLIAEGLAALQPEAADATVVPFDGPPPGKVMRCKVTLGSKRPNVQLKYVGREEDAPGKYELVPWSYERHGKTESGVTIQLDPNDPRNYVQDGEDVNFHAVYGGPAEDGKNSTRENRIFSEATPNFNITGTIRNQGVLSQLEAGRDYYVDFTPAPKS